MSAGKSQIQCPRKASKHPVLGIPGSTLRRDRSIVNMNNFLFDVLGRAGFPAGTISRLIQLQNLWGSPTALLHCPPPDSWIHMTVRLLPQRTRRQSCPVISTNRHCFALAHISTKADEFVFLRGHPIAPVSTILSTYTPTHLACVCRVNHSRPLGDITTAFPANMVSVVPVSAHFSLTGPHETTRTRTSAISWSHQALRHGVGIEV